MPEGHATSRSAAGHTGGMLLRGQEGNELEVGLVGYQFPDE
jgi:hypothetical protein